VVVVVALVVAFVAWLGSGIEPLLVHEVVPDESAAVGAHAPVARVRGKVLLEAEPGEEGGDVPKGGELVPPAPGTCTVVAWQKGERVGGPVACEGDGGFEVELGAGKSGLTAFELLVPGRLRAVVEVDVPEGGVGRLPTVALGFAEAVSGQVVDARDQPIAGALVEAMPTPNLGEPEPWRTVTDARGQFVLDTLPHGSVVLRAKKRGYVASTVQAFAPWEDVWIVLDGVMDLSGEVKGDPDLLAEVRVRLEGSAVWPAVEQMLDEDGRFVFGEIPDGVYGLEAVVEADEPGGPEYASIPLENVTPDLYVSLGLMRAFRVPVRVLDPARKPVPEARVTLGYGSIGMLQRVARTDPAGRARVGPVVPGPYVVQADAEGFLPAKAALVDVPVDGTVEEQTLVLARPASIEGIVVDEADHPVAGASVMVESEAVFAPGEGTARAQVFDVALQAAGTLGVTKGPVPEIPLGAEDASAFGLGPVTDAEGRFKLGALVPGTYHLRAVHGQHAASGVKTVKVASGEMRKGVVLRLRSGQPLGGRIRDGNGQPIAHARVDMDDGMVVFTDSRGVFDAGYRRGAVDLVVHARGMVSRRVEASVGDEPLDLELVLEPANGVVEGRVRNTNGQPIQDVRVVVTPGDGLSPTAVTWTDGRGLFEIDGLSPGPAEVELDHPEFVVLTRGTKVAAAHESEPLEVELTGGWTIEVIVREKGTGKRIEGARVSVEGGILRTTDREGRVLLTRIQGGRAIVHVAADGWVGQTVAVAREDTRSEILVELTEGGTLEGRVTDDRGEPVAGALVTVRGMGGVEEVETDASGHYRVSGLAEGEVVVAVEPPRELAAVLAPVTMESDVLRGRVTREVDLRFDRR
jgi:protocatechuate 3,4-dioxygenase beta subunit